MLILNPYCMKITLAFLQVNSVPVFFNRYALRNLSDMKPSPA